MSLGHATWVSSGPLVLTAVGLLAIHLLTFNRGPASEFTLFTVMLTYASSRGHAFIGHRLYLPARWTDDGLPVGVQLVGAPGREDVIIRVAAQLEVAQPWSQRFRSCQV